MSKIEVFEVQSAAAADGVYNCYKQKLAATAWQPGGGDKFENYEDPPIEVQVLNLKENAPVSGYENALALGDRIAAWFAKDDTGGGSWIGFPCTPDVRRARTTGDAPSELYITCNLYANDGETEITGADLGAGITVYGAITENAELDAAVPRLKINTDIFAQNIQGKWWCVQVYQASEDCLCE